MKKYLLIALVLTGCVTMQKAEKKLDSSPIESSRYCSTRFPFKDSIVTKDSVHFDTLYVPNNDTIQVGDKMDSTVMSFDTTVELHHKWKDSSSYLLWYLRTKYHTKKCPPTKVITKTMIHDTTIFRDNPASNARTRYLEGLTAQKDQTITRLTKGRTTWRLEGIIATSVLLLLLAFIVLRVTKTL